MRKADEAVLRLWSVVSLRSTRCTSFVTLYPAWSSRATCQRRMVRLFHSGMGISLTGAAWDAFWLPPLLVISKQCVNGHRDIRSRAISYLQRLLLSPQLLASEQDSLLPTILDRVLFPVMDELLKPQAYERDPQGMAETRLKAATLLCKIFLQYVVRLVESDSEVVGGLFVRVLDKLERFMRGEREILVRPFSPSQRVPADTGQNEAGESLKNVVLVMNSSGLLVPPPADGADGRTADQKNLWKASAERIERVLPGFLADSIISSNGTAKNDAQPVRQQRGARTSVDV